MTTKAIDDFEILVIGAGLVGSVVARRFAECGKSYELLYSYKINNKN